MLITMTENLILILVLSIIWSTGQVTSVETPVHVSADIYETISQQLSSHRPTVTELEGARAKYEYYYGIRYSDINKNAEVCQWGILANELNEPTYDICIMVAVALKDQNELRQTASSSSRMSVSSHYSNYDCPKISVANMAELELDEDADSLDKRIAPRVLVCPQITINDPSTHERITLEKFLIADGDYEQNSIFVFGLSNNTLGEMNLMFYLSNVLRINIIKVSSNSVQNFQRVLLQDLQPEIELNDLCNSPIAERKNICKYSAMKKFSNNEEMDLQDEDFDFDAMHLDTSGFVPYRCVERFYSIRIGFGKSEDHIYCPRQVIRIGDSVMAQRGFFYSISDDMYEKRIHIKETVLPLFRDDHTIEEKTVLPFPKRR